MTKTKRSASQIGRGSRRKGKVGERQVVHLLRDMGFPSARRSVQFCGRAGDADILCEELGGLFLEVKFRDSRALPTWMKKAEQEKKAGETVVILHRADRQPWKISTRSPDGTIRTVDASREELDQVVRRSLFLYRSDP